jgi:hypothetical protein
MRFLTLLILMLLVTVAHAEPLIVLADDAEYKAAKSSETVFEGVLERTPPPGTLGGPSRFNPFRLKVKDGAHELYVGGRAVRVSVHVGAKVRITGKLVEVEVDGKKRTELWPARLESLGETVVEAPPPPPKPPMDGVLARCNWQPAAAMTLKGGRYIIRDPETLAREMKVTGTDLRTAATATMARMLRVETIDWNKQMIVTISVGLRGSSADKLTVTKVEMDGTTLMVTYRLSASEPGGTGIGYPAETVLVDRTDGAVRFVEDKAPPKKPD